MREVLHMRLGGGVAQIRDAVRRDGRDQRVLGRGDAGLVEEDVGAGQARGAEFQPIGRGDGGAELLERQEMRVEAAPADDVAAGRRQRHLAAAGQQRPASRIEARIARTAPDRDRRRGCSWRGSASGLRSSHSADAPTERISSTRVSVSRMRGTLSSVDRMLGQQRGRDDRQRRVLVAGRLDRAPEPWPPSTMYWIARGTAAICAASTRRHWR